MSVVKYKPNECDLERVVFYFKVLFKVNPRSTARKILNVEFKTLRVLLQFRTAIAALGNF